MNSVDLETRVFLEEFQNQPEEVRQIFLYAICQTMVQVGMLELIGVSNSTGWGVTLIYKNPDTGEIFEVIKPDISKEEEEAMQAHIGDLLRENAGVA